MISTADAIMCLDRKQQEIAEPNPVSSIDYKFPAEEEMLTSPGRSDGARLETSTIKATI